MRAHARYVTTKPCSLELTDGRVIHGWVEDISVGGAGIRISQEVRDVSQFTLSFFHGTEGLRIPCTVRHTRDLWQNRFVHARFHRVTAAQQEAVDEVVRDAAGGANVIQLTEPRVMRLLAWRRHRDRTSKAS